MTVLPKFEPLEDRIVLDGVADVTVSGPTEVFIGQQDVEYTLTFDNISPTDTGYVPFIDVVIPNLGADGDDGVTFDNASFLGTPVTTQQIVFDVNGEAQHPLAVDTNGDPLVVTGTPGETLLVFELPYGSFSAGNPAVDLVMTLDFSNFADLDQDFTLKSRAGFALGNDELDNPATDPSTVGSFADTVIDQKLFELTKTNNAPESETASGPSYVYEYTLGLEVAPGQTLTNFTLVDTLPPDLVYMGNLAPAGGVVQIEPVAGNPTGPGNNTIQIFFAAVPAGTTQITFDFYVAETSAVSGNPVINPATGDDAAATNNVTGAGVWDPLDVRDADAAVSQTATDTIEISSLAVQKSSQILVDNNVAGPTPGDEFEFTLNIQVSDYFTYGDLTITDILGNGYQYVAGSAQIVAGNEGAGAAIGPAIPVGPARETITNNNPGPGETTVVWDISDALIDGGLTGILKGDQVDGDVDGVSTTLQITYRATVLDQYAPTGAPTQGDVEISQGDDLSNNVTVAGTVRDNANTATVLGTESDESSQDIDIPFGNIKEKTIYALNGVSPPPNDIVSAGDTVTWRIVYSAPLGSFEQLRLADNLPQNVFDATEVDEFILTPADRSVPPPAGKAYFGPNDQFSAFNAVDVPALNIDAPNNGVEFIFDDLSIDPRQSIEVEILFTVTIQDAIFADGLLLTNQSTAFEENTSGSEINSTAIAQFTYTEPVLGITKGVIAHNSPDADTAFSAGVGPVAFTAPGSAGARWAGTINSDGLDVTPINANISNLDAGDLVSFAIVVENTGASPKGAFNVLISDTIPAGFEIPGGGAGLNLNITDGTGGRAIGFTSAGNVDTDLFAGGITLDDRGPIGSVSVYDGVAGDNVAVITYDLQVSDTVTASQALTNTATLQEYNAIEGGGGVTPADRAPVDLTDSATATLDGVEVTKTLNSREFGTAAADRVLVGEEFTFEVTVDLPEGQYENAIIRDTVRTDGANRDYEILSARISDWDAGVLTSSTGVALNTAGVVAGDGNSVSFNLGTLTNLADNIEANDSFSFTVTARSVATQTEGRGAELGNEAAFEADGGSATGVGSVVLAEPVPVLAKNAVPPVVSSGDTVTYTVDLNNPNGPDDAPVYDIVLTDILDPNVTLDVGSVVVNGGVGATIIQGNTPGDTTIRVTVDELARGANLQITYTATVNILIEAATVVENTADVTFDSLPTDDAADERDYSISADANILSASPSISKTVHDTSFADTAGSDLAIGETVTYRITVDLAEGTSTNTRIIDTLPTTNGTLTYVSSEVIRIGTGANTNINGSNLSVGDAGSHAGGVITFDFGDLTNTPDGVDDASDQIVVEVVARLTDLTANASGDTLTNTGAIVTDQASISTTAAVQVVEPVLDIDKVVAPANADAGDVVTYQITSENTGNGPAYDIVIDDTLADIGITPTNVGAATIKIFNPALVDVTPGGPNAPVLTYPTGADGLQAIIPVLLPGHTIQIDFQGLVTDAAEFSGTVDNTAQVTRFDTDPAGNTTDPDDGRVYDASRPGYTVPSDSAAVATPDPTIAKAVIATDNPVTAGNSVTFSEIVTYNITLDLPEGTSDVIVTDALPAGLTPVDAEVTSVGAAMTIDNLSAGDTDSSSAFITVGPDGGYRFNFGTIVNAGDNNAANDQIVITVRAQVTDAAGVSDGDALTNTATLALVNPLNGTVLDSFTDTANVQVVEPVLDIDKQVNPAAADAGDTVQFTIRSTNTGNAPAYDIIIQDMLSDPGLDIPAPAVASIRILNNVNADVTPGGADAPSVTYSNAFGRLQADIPVLLENQTIEIVFEAVLTDQAEFSGSVDNTAEVTRFDTDPAGTGADPDNGRVYDTGLAGYTVPEDDAAVATPDLALVKTYLSSNNADTGGTDVTFGEEVTYRLTITSPEGSGDLVLTDTLPDGLTPLSARVVSMGNGVNTTSDNLAAGDTDASGSITVAASSVTFDFGTVTITGTDNAAAAADTIVVEVTARVDDVATVTTTPPNDALTNTATLQITDPNTGVTLQPDVTATETVTAVEPNLVIDKTGPRGANPGDVIDYTVTITNTGDGPAYDILFEDVFSDPLLTLAAPPAPAFDVDGAGFAPVITPSGTGFSTIIPALQPGEVLTVTYSAQLDAGAADARTFINTATTTYDTVPDGDPDSPTARDYNSDGDHKFGTVPVMIKEIERTSQAETGDAAHTAGVTDLTIGEEVTYKLTLILPEIPMDSVIVTDQLPAGMEFVSAVVTSVGAGIATGPFSANPGPANLYTLEFGAVTNNNDGSIGPDDEIVVELTARVLDIPANSDGAVLTNNAQLEVVAGGVPLNIPTDSVDVEIVEPALTLDKDGPDQADPGDTITYTLTIENSGTGPAYDLQVVDTLADVDLTLAPGSVTMLIDGAAIVPAPVVNEPGSGFTTLVPALLPGQTLVVTYDAVVGPGIGAGGTYENTATVDFDTVKDNDPATPTARPGSLQDSHLGISTDGLQKTILSTSNPDTGVAEHTPLDDVSVGEVITYELLVSLQETTFDSVVLTDTLPAGLRFVSAEVFSVGAGITGITAGSGPASVAGQLITFNFANVVNPSDGTIGADDELRIRVQAVVDDVPAATDGAILTNTSSLTVTPQGGNPLPTVTADAAVEVVEPQPSITKAVSDPEPDVTDVITYTVQIANDPAATGSFYNVVVSDPLPLGLTLTGNVTLSNPALGTVTTGGNGASELVINIPQLAPGQTLTITYDALVGYGTPGFIDLDNTATIAGAGSPDPTSPALRSYETNDSARIYVEAPLATDSDPDENGRLLRRFDSLGVDNTAFIPFLKVDPIFSGSTAPGSSVTINIYKADGSLSATRHILADTAGQWIAIFPHVELEDSRDDFWNWYSQSNIFDAPVRVVDNDFNTTGLDEFRRYLSIGADIKDDAYYLQVAAGPSYVSDAAAKQQTFYSGALTQDAFAVADTLNVRDVFDNITSVTMERLYGASQTPLGNGMNTFNNAFLAGATAIPGSAN